MTNFSKSIFLLPFSMLALAGAAAAVEQHSVPVSYAGLDLGSPAGVQAFEKRIKAGVRSVCSAPDSGIRSLAETHRCRSEAFASARPQQLRVVAQAQQRQVLASR